MAAECQSESGQERHWCPRLTQRCWHPLRGGAAQGREESWGAVMPETDGMEACPERRPFYQTAFQHPCHIPHLPHIPHPCHISRSWPMETWKCFKQWVSRSSHSGHSSILALMGYSRPRNTANKFPSTDRGRVTALGSRGTERNAANHKGVAFSWQQPWNARDGRDLISPWRPPTRPRTLMHLQAAR